MGNALGTRGEAIFFTLMTEFHADTGPIFRPQFLGDRWPTVDYLVELDGARGAVPFFFVQVKTTRSGYTRREGRLKVKVREQDMRRLAEYPAPTYIVGIDERRERGYLLSANGEHVGPLFSIPICYPIHSESREWLWEEVVEYWKARARPGFSSMFADPAWRQR